MPSSLIFAGLVVLWLLILVPAVARRQQEVARPSVAALSGRVLDRPQRRYRTEEVDDVHDSDDDVAARGTTRVSEPARVPEARGSDDEYPEYSAEDKYAADDRYADDDYSEDDYAAHGYDDGAWERRAPRYRPGRGGFDPAAAALTAKARYVFRQRVVLGMLVAAVLAALVALLAAPGVWWAHVTIDVALVGYLVYLRRQVRMEEAIRDRRAARMAGTRRPPAADDPELDEWARRGQEVARAGADPDDELEGHPVDGSDVDDDIDDADDPERVTGTGEPIGPLRVTGADAAEMPALPRLTPAPPPPLPAGTMVVGDDLDDPDLHDLGGPARPDYRRAAGE